MTGQPGSDRDVGNSGSGSSPSLLRRWGELIAGITVVLIAAFWFIGLLDRVIMPLLVASGIESEVPDLYRLSFVEAESLCYSYGLSLRKGERTRIDDNISPETILDQFPLAGVIVKRGKVIEVVVSEPSHLVACPNLRGMSARDATIQAEAVGLSLPEENRSYRHSSSYPDGVILFQTPAAGDSLPPNGELAITISLGELPKEFYAPDLVGRNIDAIYLVLAKSGLRLGKVEKYPDRRAASGMVLTQEPNAGTRMKRGDKIDIRIAIEPETQSDQ